MGNIRHPYDASIEDLSFLRPHIVRDFVSDDGQICEAEQDILTDFDEAVNRLRLARGLERGIELLMKQEGKPTRYTHDMFKDIGVHLEPLDVA